MELCRYVEWWEVCTGFYSGSVSTLNRDVSPHVQSSTVQYSTIQYSTTLNRDVSRHEATCPVQYTREDTAPVSAVVEAAQVMENQFVNTRDSLLGELLPSGPQSSTVGNTVPTWAVTHFHTTTSSQQPGDRDHVMLKIEIWNRSPNKNFIVFGYYDTAMHWWHL